MTEQMAPTTGQMRIDAVEHLGEILKTFADFAEMGGVEESDVDEVVERIGREFGMRLSLAAAIDVIASIIDANVGRSNVYADQYMHLFGGVDVPPLRDVSFEEAEIVMPIEGNEPEVEQ